MVKPKGPSRMTRPSELLNEKRKAYSQDPIARALMEVCPVGSRGFSSSLLEVVRLQTYGIEITPELIRRVGEMQNSRKAEPNSNSNHYPYPDGKTGDLVYYARLGNRVKIGTTTNLAKRMAVVQPEEVLIVEPGDRQVEKMRHLEFSHLNSHLEWFRYEDELVAHVKAMQEAAKKNIIVDTAALAFRLDCTPAYVRQLVAKGIFAAVDTKMIGKMGRPTMRFDLDLVEHVMKGSNPELDQDLVDV